MNDNYLRHQPKSCHPCDIRSNSNAMDKTSSAPSYVKTSISKPTYRVYLYVLLNIIWTTFVLNGYYILIRYFRHNYNLR